MTKMANLITGMPPISATSKCSRQDQENNDLPPHYDILLNYVQLHVLIAANLAFVRSSFIFKK